MPCERLNLGDGVAILCGGRRRAKRCSVCRARPGSRLCDGKVARGKTCDAALCIECSVQSAAVGGDPSDFCPAHAPPDDVRAA